MTTNQHFKQLVRARMAATGESYATAREQLQAATTDVQLIDPVVVDVHGRHGQTVAFTPEGTRILSGGQDARIAILDAVTGSMAEPAGISSCSHVVVCWVERRRSRTETLRC